MKHFDISEWTDFARDVAADADRAAMEAHVSSGCVTCRATLNLVKRVVAGTRADLRSEPPEYVVRCAKAISTLLRPQRSPLSRLVARLVYDSLRDPIPVGLRAEDRVSRHTLYEAGPFYLDLRLEQERGSPFVTLVGQLTNRQDPDSSLPEAPVLLMAQRDIVAHSVYNRFGEFQMDYPPSRHLRLCVALNPPGKRIELSLDRLVAERPKPPQRGKKAVSGHPGRRSARLDRKK
jgi:hypothetical protein